jgi:plastocyanin
VSRPIALLTALGVLALSTLGAGCGGGHEPTTTGPDVEANLVDTRDFAFAPSALTVPSGTTVTFTNTGETTHTVKGRGFFSEAINPGESYRHRFTQPGTYRYLCTLHPTLMRGAITVR